jgi:hypothetical protein
MLKSDKFVRLFGKYHLVEKAKNGYIAGLL